MEKYNRKNLRNIQMIIQNKTGISVSSDKKIKVYKIRKIAFLTGCLLCLVPLCAYTYEKFSDLKGDRAGFASVYKGDGRFEIVIMNYSDKELDLQDNVKVMQWSTGEEVEGNNKKIKMEMPTIAPHSEGVALIDISEGYDVETMMENLHDGDWYYFILTNNNFVFGQDWLCSFDFEIEQTEDVKQKLAKVEERKKEEQAADEQLYSIDNLIYGDWIWPTDNQRVTAFYGEQSNGNYSDHINIAGAVGDDVYAVADGVVVETEFEYVYGNYIIVDLGDGIMVKYGHLQDIKVFKGDEVLQGQVIATLGQTGMATGPNLSFAVTIDGEEVNPLITHIEQTLDTADGTTLIINADVNVSGITRVSQYEYILTDINEEKREALFESVFAETKNKAEYDELNDVWTIELDSEIRNYFLYQISYSNGGKTIPGEQIIILENRYYDLYPFEDNRLDLLSDSKVDIVLDDVKNMCEQVVDSIIDTDDYAIDYIYAYGNNGRRPYYKVVFKRMLDGMPVTTHNNLTFLVDNDGIEMVKGSLFSIKETGLEEIILSPEEAVIKLREQAEYLNFEEESQVFVSEVTLEYFVVISQDGGILVTPIWRFGIGKDEGERNSMRHKILAIDAVTGELIWEERENTM